MPYNITEIEKIYPDWYNPDFDLSKSDQQWIWENTPLTDTAEERLRTLTSNKQNNSSPNLNRSVNGSGKIQVKVSQKQDKVTAISLLTLCRARTPRQEVATLLEIVFGNHQSQEGHWLYIARAYNPKTINAVIRYMIKKYENGEIDLDNPNSYFTYVIQRKRKRKGFIRDTSGGHKQQSEGQT